MKSLILFLIVLGSFSVSAHARAKYAIEGDWESEKGRILRISVRSINPTVLDVFFCAERTYQEENRKCLYEAWVMTSFNDILKAHYTPVYSDNGGVYGHHFVSFSLQYQSDDLVGIDPFHPANKGTVLITEDPFHYHPELSGSGTTSILTKIAD